MTGKILKYLLLIISVAAAYLIINHSAVTKPAAENNIGNTNSFGNEFIICAINDAHDLNYDYIDRVFGFNLWHYYTGSVEIQGKHYPDGWFFWSYDDHLFSPIQDYENDIKRELQNIGSHHMFAWMQRPKIEYLCYGQRSDYRCVDTPYVDPDLWFYTFQSPSHTGQDVMEGPPYGNGNYIRFCNFRIDSPGFVVSRLRTNAEQSHRNSSFDAYRWDSEHYWYIKPRIRIDADFPQNHPETPVCQIKVIAQDGNTVLKSVILKGKNFLNGYYNYDGRYLEEFFNLPPSDSLRIYGDWGDNWVYAARGNREVDTDNNKADIQVYWFGNCNMWIDRIRVDNDIANDLLSTNPNNPTHKLYDQWLEWEAKIIACQSGNTPWNFFIELFEFNQIPCIEYVNRRLDSLCGKQVELLADQFTFYQYHMGWEDRGRIVKADQMIRQYIDKIGVHTVFGGHDPFTSVENVEETYSRIPYTLPVTVGNNIMAKPTAPVEYEAWLQGNLDTIPVDLGADPSRSLSSSNEPCPQQPQLEGKFIYELKLGNEISKLANIPFITWIQSHQWFTHCSDIQREPTNEEQDLIVNLAIAYGVKGVAFYLYNGWQEGNNYCYGLTETDGKTLRLKNVYGQLKFAKFIRIVDRLKVWGPYLMSFDNRFTNSYIFRFDDERQDMFNRTYFKDIISLKETDNKENSGLSDTVQENPQKTYLQVSTFKSTSSNSSNLYFMLVNRRCSPYINESTEDNRGGKRDIKIKFKSDCPELKSQDLWKITDIDNPNWSLTFSKSKKNYIDLGSLMPGEGKLYEVSPYEGDAPKKFDMNQNYPNPFNPVTNIKYALARDGNVKITIYDILGRKIDTLVDEYKKAGFYQVKFDGSNLASGVYFYKMEAGKFEVSKKMILYK